MLANQVVHTSANDRMEVLLDLEQYPDRHLALEHWREDLEKMGMPLSNSHIQRPLSSCILQCAPRPQPDQPADDFNGGSSMCRLMQGRIQRLAIRTAAIDAKRRIFQ